MYLFCFCITLAYITLLQLPNPYADAAVIGTAINPIPVTNYVIKSDVATRIKNVWTDFIIVVDILYFCKLFFDYW